MSSYHLSLAALVLAFAAHMALAGLSLKAWWPSKQAPASRRLWLSLAATGAILAFLSARGLEMALHVGIYDTRLALALMLVSLLLCYVLRLLRRDRASGPG